MASKLISRFIVAAILLTAVLSAEPSLASHRLLTLYGAGSQSLPTKQFSFVSGANTLDPSITFTRSGATASDYNAVGTLVTGVAANAARFDYSPSTLALNGLLLEQSSTNIVLQSTFASGWGTNSASFTANNALSPDGTLDAATFNEGTGASTQHYMYSGVNSLASQGAVYEISFLLKAGTRSTCGIVWGNLGFTTGIRANVDLSAGTISAGSAFGSGSVTATGIQALPNGWYRAWISGFSANAGAGAAISAVEGQNPSGTTTYTGTNGTIFVYGNEVELASFPMSYIPTTSSAVTRNPDSAVASSIPWFNAAQGAFLVQAIVPTINTSRNTTIASFNDGTANNQIKVILNSSGVPEAQLIVGGTAFTSGGSLSAVTPGTPFKAALSFGPGGNLFSANGSADTVGTFGAASLPSGISQLTLGNDGAGAQALNGWEQLFKDWNYSQPISTLNQLTH